MLFFHCGYGVVYCEIVWYGVVWYGIGIGIGMV